MSLSSPFCAPGFSHFLCLHDVYTMFTRCLHDVSLYSFYIHFARLGDGTETGQRRDENGTDARRANFARNPVNPLPTGLRCQVSHTSENKIQTDSIHRNVKPRRQIKTAWCLRSTLLLQYYYYSSTRATLVIRREQHVSDLPWGLLFELRVQLVSSAIVS